ncbi:MAG: hypothetical protein WDN27_05400 [Candidatus Saccharibacteria bacterium]
MTYQLGQKYALLKIEIREIDDHGLPLLEIYRNNDLLKTVPIPAKRHSWVRVFEDDEPTAAVHAGESKKRALKPYDIAVATRQLDYYSIPVATEKETA